MSRNEIGIPRTSSRGTGKAATKDCPGTELGASEAMRPSRASEAMRPNRASGAMRPNRASEAMRERER